MLPHLTRPRTQRITGRITRRITGLITGRGIRRIRRWRATTPTATFAAVLLVVPAFDYIVKPGDTVWGIASKHDSTVGAIVEANDLEDGGRLIYPGDVLTIPAAHKRGGRSERRPTTAQPASTRTSTTKPVSNDTSGRLAPPDKRRIVTHTVKTGDTIGAIARRYHAWTAELIEANGGSTMLQVGERLRVPVVVRAVQKANRSGDRGPTSEAARRAAVRRLITSTAKQHGVDPQLALAVSWQEAGWQQDVVSSADARGVMQVIPSTGRWLSEMTGRDLDLRDVEDNVYAGVVLLKFLTDRTGTRRSLAGYYQGLASVEENGMYDDTKRYIANVLALKKAFEKGDYPY